MKSPLPFGFNRVPDRMPPDGGCVSASVSIASRLQPRSRQKLYYQVAATHAKSPLPFGFNRVPDAPVEDYVVADRVVKSPLPLGCNRVPDNLSLSASPLQFFVSIAFRLQPRSRRSGRSMEAPIVKQFPLPFGVSAPGRALRGRQDSAPSMGVSIAFRFNGPLVQYNKDLSPLPFGLNRVPDRQPSVWACMCALSVSIAFRLQPRSRHH